jgi:hypothetical protein
MAESVPAISFEQSFDRHIDVDMSNIVLQQANDITNIQIENLMTSDSCLPANLPKCEAKSNDVLNMTFSLYLRCNDPYVFN